MAARARFVRRGPAVGALALGPMPARRSAPAPPAPPRKSPRRCLPAFADLYRGVFGVLLVVGAALLFLSSTTSSAACATRRCRGRRRGRAGAHPRAVPVAARPQPRRRARRADPLAGARRGRRPPARLRPADARAVQKRADDPREVAALARRQERELRAWLHDGRPRRRADASPAALRGRRGGGRGRPPRRRSRS